MRAVITHLPATSALGRAVNADRASWGLTEQLLAVAVDVLQMGNWQRGGGKGRKPKPIERPGVGPKRTKMGTASLTHAEVDRLLAPINRGR